eukprot:CAMPEP_0117583614 /NCGR_PEP_ID=MMETSP0784-20121206/67119_1 /TAXON_ID=39447 /ORGANISM="" /LENGTH=40 /DNA_ID= /DNA_START= /DNA_END= /DNA_ORIENTATION=
MHRVANDRLPLGALNSSCALSDGNNAGAGDEAGPRIPAEA